MENVPTVPDMFVPGYVTQRFNLFASECGLAQSRNRSFQFGSRDGKKLVLLRTESQLRLKPCAMATDGDHGRRRPFAEVCELQGLPRGFDLPGLSRSAKFRAVGNGVPVPMAYAVAVAIRDRLVTHDLRLCLCDCGRPVTGKQTMATAACRKRMERRRVTSVVRLGRDETRLDGSQLPSSLTENLAVAGALAGV
jgi:DNA (cytosine-5)-methyltransferase 1